MTRLGIGFVAAVALASVGCAGSTRSAKASSGSSGGEMIATAAEAGASARPGGASTAQGAASSASTPTAKEVEGRIELIDRGNNVTLSGTESVGHAFDRLKIDEATEILVDGEQATIAEVHPGDEVRASFSGEGDELRIERLEVTSSDE